MNKLNQVKSEINNIITSSSDSDYDIALLICKNPLLNSFFGGPIKVYEKFGLTPSKIDYSEKEHEFRIKCLYEEINELNDAIVANDHNEIIDAICDTLVFAIGTTYRMDTWQNTILSHPYHINKSLYDLAFVNNDEAFHKTLEYMLRANIDELSTVKFDDSMFYEIVYDILKEVISLSIAYLSNTYDHAEIIEYYDRITNANLSKEIGSLTKRGSFEIDLVKPTGWKAPTFDGLSINQQI